MTIERVETVVMALEFARNTKKEPPEKINNLISKIRANADLSQGEKEFIDNLLRKDEIIPVFSGPLKRGVS